MMKFKHNLNDNHLSPLNIFQKLATAGGETFFKMTQPGTIRTMIFFAVVFIGIKTTLKNHVLIDKYEI
jgi:hypothetical protein